MASLKPRFSDIERIVPYSRHWCAWRLYDKGDGSKPQKVPCKGRGKDQSLASTSSDGWLSFEAAQALYEKGGFAGVGVLMLDSDLLTCIDVDNCLDDAGNVLKTAAEVVSELVAWGSFIEVSQGGHGLHCFIRGFRLEDCGEKVILPGEHSLEIYDCDSSRYMAVTGKPWKGAEPVSSIELRQTQLEAFMQKFGFVAKSQKAEAEGVEPTWQVRSDAEVLGSLMQVHNQKGRITRLLSGSASDHENDLSKANLALCGELAFITRDAEQIDRLFRQSGAMRPKWDSKRGSGTWGSRTIRKALRAQTDSLDAFRARKASEKQAVVGASVALKAKGAAMLTGGIDDLLDSKGRLHCDLHTLSELLLRDRPLAECVFYDEFRGQPQKVRPLSGVLGKAAPCQIGDLVDDDLIALSAYLGRVWGLDVKVQSVKEAVSLWARALSRNPITERLDELAAAWDGKARLGNWLIDYCHADTRGANGRDIAGYLSAVGARWLIQMVARAYQPGCQADSLLVMEGKQGARKSTAARVLCEAIDPNAFLEGFSLDGQSEQNTLMRLEGMLIVEWGELAGLTKHEAARVKQFITQREDSYRKPYDRMTTKSKRTATFLASTNEASYLRDLTGNRRVWPVKVGLIDIARLREAAGQIIGEAVLQYRTGARYWIAEHSVEDAELQSMTLAEQAARLIPDAWDDLAVDITEMLCLGKLAVGAEQKMLGSNTGVSINDLMEAAGLEGVRTDAGGARSQRFANALKKVGWVSYSSSGRTKWKLPEEVAARFEKAWR